MKKLQILIIALFFSSCVNNQINHYTKEGYCIVKSKKQMILGLNRFDTKEQFLRTCKGKMLFIFDDFQCNTFTMKNMKFDIYIENEIKKTHLKRKEKIHICGKIIIESI